jgi:hypothetical protein
MKNKIIEDFRLTVKCPFLFYRSPSSRVFQNLNLSRKYGTAKKHLEINDRFVPAILSNQSIRINQLIHVYTHQGASRSAITQAIQDVSASLLNLRSYTQNEYNMAMIMF